MLKKILKWTGIILLVFILFILITPFIFKGKIIQFVKDKANENLNAKVNFGKFDLALISTFPDFTLTVDNISVANIGDFEGDTLLRTKNLTVSLNLMSVISGSQYKIRSVSLEEPLILVKILKNGTANWDITKSSVGAAKTPDEESAPFKITLKKMAIKNAHIVYDDASLGVMTLLDGFNYTMSGDFSSDNFTMENNMSIDKFTMAYGGVSYLSKVNTKVKANIGADMAAMKFTFKENEINLNDLGLGIDGFFAMPKDGYDLDMKFNVKQTEFKNILSLVPAAYTKDFSSVKTSGKLALDGFVKGMMTDKTMPAFAINLKIDDAMFQYPALPKSVNDITLDVHLDNKTGDPDNTIIDVKKFHIEMAGNPVDVVMHIATPVSDPNINGTILGKVDLASLKDVLPLDKNDNLNGKITVDVKMKGRMSSIEKEKYEEFDAKGQIIVMDMNYKSKDTPYDMMIKSMTLNFSPKFVELAGFDSQIGRNDVQAAGKIENIFQYVFKDSLLKGTFTMKSSLMDLNQFMNAEDTVAAVPADTSAMCVIEVPSNIDFVLNSTMEKLIYDDIVMSNVSGKVMVRNSKVIMENLKMNMMGGELMISSATYNTMNLKTPTVDFDMNATDFDIPMTVKYFNTVEKLAPIAKYTTGKFSTHLRYASTLDKTMMPDMKTLNGDGKLQTKKVVVSGFEPLNKLADALGGMDKFKRADFSDLNISYHIKDGKVTTDEFPFKQNSVSGSALGSTALDQTIDYTMKMEIPTADMPAKAKEFITKQMTAVSALGVNFKMPDKVKVNALFGGTVLKPTVKANYADVKGNVKEVATEQVKKLVEDKKQEVKQEIKKNVEEEKKKILEEAAKQSQAIKDAAKSSSEQIKKEGYAQADALQNKGGNMIEKMANKKLAEKLRKETDEKAKKMADEGNQKADKLMAEAQAKADAVK